MPKQSTNKTPSGKTPSEKLVEQSYDQGFSGVEVDPTPNESYTVAGVTAEATTPETPAVRKASQEA